MHHTVSPNREWSPEEEELHILEIYNQHRAQGRFSPLWSAPGIGYNWLAFPSARIYYVGNINVQRAAVAAQNDHIVACALVGDFTAQAPTTAVLDAVKILRESVEEELERALTVHPHRFYGGTACPGNTFVSWIDQV